MRPLWCVGVFATLQLCFVLSKQTEVGDEVEELKSMVQHLNQQLNELQKHVEEKDKVRRDSSKICYVSNHRFKKFRLLLSPSKLELIAHKEALYVTIS